MGCKNSKKVKQIHNHGFDLIDADGDHKVGKEELDDDQVSQLTSLIETDADEVESLGRLVINLDEVNEQLEELDEQKKINEYLVSEIVIRSVSKDKLEKTINELKNKISIDGFEKVAINFSISESSNRGGDMGWVSENMMTKSFRSKVANTPIGKISDPIMLQEGIMLFKVRDKREQEITLEQAKEELVKAEKSKVLNMYAISHYDKLRRSVTINYY